MTHHRRILTECIMLFGGVPVVLTVLHLQGGFPFFTVLILLTGITLWIGYRDPGVLFQPPTTPLHRNQLVLKLAGAAAILVLLTWTQSPERLFRFPRESTALWVKFLLVYPVLSVLPQEFLYRTYFMQRYEPLFGNGPWRYAVNVFFFTTACASACLSEL